MTISHEIEILTNNYARVFLHENVNRVEIENVGQFIVTIRVYENDDENVIDRYFERYTIDIEKMKYQLRCALFVHKLFINVDQIVSNIETFNRDEYRAIKNEFIVDANEQYFVRFNDECEIEHIETMQHYMMGN